MEKKIVKTSRWKYFGVCWIIYWFNLLAGNEALVVEELKVPYIPHVVVNKDKNSFDYENILKLIRDNSNRDEDNIDNNDNANERSFYNNNNNYQIRDTINPEESISYPTYVHPSHSASTEKPIPHQPIVEIPPNVIFVPYAKVDLSNAKSTSVATSTVRNVPPSGYGATGTAYYANPDNGKNGKSDDTAVPIGTMNMKYGFTANKDTAKERKIVPPSFQPIPEPVTGSGSDNSYSCNLKSVRYLYEGDCMSRKPVVEVVCADRCVQPSAVSAVTSRLHATGFMQPAPYKSTKMQSSMSVEALHCVDGTTRRKRVKLYCKNGAILTNIVKVVTDCVCTEHRDRIHAKAHHPLPTHRYHTKRYVH